MYVDEFFLVRLMYILNKNGVWLALGMGHVKFDQHWTLHGRGDKIIRLCFQKKNS